MIRLFSISSVISALHTLSLHDALPILPTRVKCLHVLVAHTLAVGPGINPLGDRAVELLRPNWSVEVCRCAIVPLRSEEHTSELQSRGHLVCRLLLAKKKRNNIMSGQ